jgi:hypothetical protein
LFFVPHTTTQMPFSGASRLQRCAALDKYSGTVAPLASITMGQNRIDQTVFHRFRGGKEAIALGITFNLF